MDEVQLNHKPKHIFSEVIELPRNQIEVRPDMFQGRDTMYAEETVEKILREGFDKSREPIVVWKSPEGKYIVISGHSRWEASRRLFESGDKSLETMPVKIFQGSLHDAMDYALLESNREVTQEGLKSDLKAYKRAKERGYNREYLKSIFKPESRLRMLEDISHLDENGSFLSYLGTPAEKSLPYLQRNAQWVGVIRNQLPQLTNSHEEEMFRYLYAVNSDSEAAGKKKLTITKDQFFNLINRKVSRIDFDPAHALNLDEHVSTSALTDPALEQLAEIDKEIDRLVQERTQKDILIAQAYREGKGELVNKFKQRQVDINQILTRKLLEKERIKLEIGKIERSAVDLFSQEHEAESTPDLRTNNPLSITKQSEAAETTSHESLKQSNDLSMASDDFNPEDHEYIGENPVNTKDYAWEMSQKDYQQIKAIEKTGFPHLLDPVDAEHHEKIVEWALKQDQFVPPEAYEKYPWLKKYLAGAATDKNVVKRTDLLQAGNWFKEHPQKVLGEEFETTNAYNKPITKVKGTLEDALQKIDTTETSIRTDHPLDELSPAMENAVLTKLLSDPAKRANIERSITRTRRSHSEKHLRKVKTNEGSVSETLEQEYYTFDDILAQYNEGISEEEIKAWIWYKRKSKGLNDETVILNKKNGWSKYVVPLSAIGEKLKAWLKAGVLCYHNADYVPSVLYYAEHIHEKIEALENQREAVVEAVGEAQYKRQLYGLTQILPQRLSLTDDNISQRLFINPLSQFARETFISEMADGTKVVPSKEEDAAGHKGGSIITAFKNWLNEQPKKDFKKSTSYNIISFYLEKNSPPRHYKETQRQRVKQYAKTEGDAFFVRFLAEAISRNDQAEIEHRWNKMYNSYVDINYFKVPVAFTCSRTFKNKPLFIRKAQREGIGFISVHGSGCVAYDVGVGKTMTAILSLAQALEIGQCKRPFIVVPNATYTNWLKELRGVTENGKVVLTGILPQYEIVELYNLSDEYVNKLKDKNGRIKAIPEGSIALLTYEGLNKLCFSDATWKMIGEELFEILNQGTDDERDGAKLKERIETLMGKGLKGGNINIEDLGFDYFVADEAHAMKKSFTNVKGDVRIIDAEESTISKKKAKSNEKPVREKPSYDIRSGEPSMTALRGFMISQYIARNNHMRNVQLLTATPFTNSPLEIYSMLALICYQELTKWGIKNLKDFFDTFIRTSIELVITAKLRPERKEVVMGFNNLIALQQLIFKFINYKTGEDANIQRPNKIVLPLLNTKDNGHVIPLPVNKQISTNLPMTAVQQSHMQNVEDYITGKLRFDSFCTNPHGLEEEDDDGPKSRGTAVDEKEMDKNEMEVARMLRGLSFARQLALSPYLYSCHFEGRPSFKEYIETSPKLLYTMKCIQSVKEFHEKRSEEVSGQVIYMNAGVEYFPLIKEYLVKIIGYKESEVGIISSGISRIKKEAVKEGFLSGLVKIIIGSGTIKEGINLQDLASTMYNLWLDWNPTDIKQLEGRIWRFGNRFANVRIVMPLMEDSIDMFIFQKLEEKTSRINEIWYRAGKVNALNLEEFNPAELKLGLVTNPTALANLQLMGEREHLEDDIDEILNQRALLEYIHEQRQYLAKNISFITELANRIKPPKQAGKDRTLDTNLKIVHDYLKDASNKATYKEQETYVLTVRAHNATQRALVEILQPRGLDLHFDEQKLFQRMESEVDSLKQIIHDKTGEEAIAARAQELAAERERRGYLRKSVDQRVEEFTRLNNKALTELMTYTASEDLALQTNHRELATDLNTSAESIEEMEAIIRDMEEMESLLQQMDALNAA